MRFPAAWSAGAGRASSRAAAWSGKRLELAGAFVGAGLACSAGPDSLPRAVPAGRYLAAHRHGLTGTDRPQITGIQSGIPHWYADEMDNPLLTSGKRATLSAGLRWCSVGLIA